MPEEADKLQETSDSSQKAKRSMRQTAKEEATPLGRFFKKISLLFISRPAPSDVKLSGRIVELQETAGDLLRDLILIKESLRGSSDDHLYALVCAIIDPTIKEISRLEKVMEHNGTAAQQVKTYARYVELIDKARSWTALKGENINSTTISNLVLEQAIQEFNLRIDRDLQVVQDYLNHAVNHASVPDDYKRELKNRLIPVLTPALLKLQDLRKPSAKLSIQTLASWRSTADNARETHFSAALHSIDTFFTSSFPANLKENESEHSAGLLAQFTDLEQKIERLVIETESANSFDESQRSVYASIIEQLEDDAHKLNGNLHLSHEQGERVLELLEALSALREKN